MHSATSAPFLYEINVQSSLNFRTIREKAGFACQILMYFRFEPLVNETDISLSSFKIAHYFKPVRKQRHCLVMHLKNTYKQILDNPSIAIQHPRWQAYKRMTMTVDAARFLIQRSINHQLGIIQHREAN